MSPPGVRVPASRVPLIAAAGLYVAALILGLQLAVWATSQLGLEMLPSPGADPFVHRTLLVALAAYVVLMAIPFVPGVEIGLMLMLVFGRDVCLLVYLATIGALVVSFAVGRLVPRRALVAGLASLRLRRADRLAGAIERGRSRDVLADIAGSRPGRWLAWLLEHRHLAIAAALNVPGNALIGGGGSIGLIAGTSRVVSFPAFLITVSIGVAPFPLAVAFSEALWR